MESMVSKTFIKVINLFSRIFVALLIGLFAMIALCALFCAFTGDGLVGIAGAAAAAFIAWALVELFYELKK